MREGILNSLNRQKSFGSSAILLLFLFFTFPQNVPAAGNTFSHQTGQPAVAPQHSTIEGPATNPPRLDTGGFQCLADAQNIPLWLPVQDANTGGLYEPPGTLPLIYSLLYTQTTSAFL